MRHGVLTPAQKIPRAPARVVNAKSKKKTANIRIRLDKLLRATKPRICIKRRLGGIGDVLMTTPLTKAIKILIPGCYLVYATDLKYSQGALGDVITHNPYVDQLIPFHLVKDNEYDYVVDVTATGLSQEKSGTIPPNRIDMFADEVGIDISSDPLPIYMINTDERKWAEDFFKELIPKSNKDTKFIAIQARSNDARRTWPLDYVSELVKLLSKEPNTQVLLFDWGNTVSRWGELKTDNVHLLMDKRLTETAAIIDRCDVIVCPDSAMLHLAGALQKKIVTIFGPIPPESRINYYANATAITKDMPCKNCVTGDSLVSTTTGYKQIQDITKDDMVLTNSGAPEKVLQVHKNDRDNRKLLEIDVFGSYKPITLTEEHKLLVAKRTYSWKAKDALSDKRQAVPILSKPVWTEAKDVSTGEYCCIPIPKTIEPHNPLLQSKDLAWLVGLFVAEGWSWTPFRTSREYNVKFAISNQEKHIEDRVQNIVLENPHVFFSHKRNVGFFHVKPNSIGESNVITVCNKNFVSLLHSLFGKTLTQRLNLSNKYIPNELAHAPNEIIEAFLSGLFQGDGYTSVKSDVYTTSKEHLAYGIQLLFAKLGQVAKVYQRKRDTNYKKDSIIYRVYASRDIKWKRWYKTDTHLLVPIKSIKESTRQDVDVWDITVENDPTFTINNTSIFDCWYTPHCNKNSGTKLECLVGIKPEEVLMAVRKKIISPYVPLRNIVYGNNKTAHGQDNVILVRRKTNGLGDLLMTTPMLAALKLKYPNKDIQVACQKKLWPVLENNPNVSKLLDVDKGINYKRFYATIDVSSPCARYESSRLASGKTVQKSRVEIFAEAAGVRNQIKTLKPEYYITKEEYEWAGEFITKSAPSNKPKIVIGLRSAEMYRDWPEKHFNSLFDKLRSNFEIVLLDHSREHHFKNVVDACGFPLRKAMAIMARCQGLITVDTGLLHFGAALNIPTVAIFGPIDYKARCKGYKNVTVIVSDLDCVPCWRNATRKCKKTNMVRSHSQCLTDITPKQVATVAENKFKGKQ